MVDNESAVSSEKAFSDLWERALELRPNVVGRDGMAYEVLFPGVRNQGAGPDFKGAVLRRDGHTVGGDVELHLDSSGWRAHGHHGDPNYRGVVLQVVLKARDAGRSVQAPPTAEAHFGSTAGLDPLPEPDTERYDLRALGFGRFLSKSAGFSLEFESKADADQVLYNGVLDAMGYARNRRPFQALAEKLPVRRLAALAREPRSVAEFAVLSALVVGAGLICTVEGHEAVQMRRVTKSLAVRRVVPERAWSNFRVRPVNSPTTRIRGIAPFLARHMNTGVVRGSESLFCRGGVTALIADIENRPFIGRGLAVTTVANVLLPALHAYARLRGAAGAETIESEFRQMRSPPQDSVTRGVSSALGLNLRPRSASEHFGLHALARSESWPGAR